MTVLTLSLYRLILIRAHGAPEINEALNYVADTLLYAGAAVALASASPPDPLIAGRIVIASRDNSGLPGFG